MECLNDNSVLDNNLIPEFNYLPVITEIVSAKCIPHILSIPLKRSLSVDYDYNYSRKCFTGGYSGPTSDILAIKNDFQTRFQRKVSFSTIVSAIVAAHCIRHLTKSFTQINIGIIGGFINPDRCNNFGLIVVPIQIKDNPDLFDIVQQIDKAVSAYGASMLTATYLTSNIYNWNIRSQKIVDIVVSYMPIIKPMQINGIEYDVTESSLPYVSMPVYNSVITTNGKYVINSTITSNDIDKKSFFADKTIIPGFS